MQEFLDKIENIRFVDVDELFVKKKYIREMYSEKEQSVKEIYKWYFYFQLCGYSSNLMSSTPASVRSCTEKSSG
jgi:hypothetical protein